MNTDFTDLMSHNTKIGIVTAAGYTQAERYYERLHGLLEAIKESDSLTPAQKQNIIVMGNFHLSFNSPFIPILRRLDIIIIDTISQAESQTFFSHTPPHPPTSSLTFPDATGSCPVCQLGLNPPSPTSSTSPNLPSANVSPTSLLRPQFSEKNAQLASSLQLQGIISPENPSKKPSLSCRRNSR